MGYGVGDFFADVATGGLYSATRGTIDAVGGLAGAVGGASGTAGGVAGQAAGAVTGSTGQAAGTFSGTVSGTVAAPACNLVAAQARGCCRYVIEGDFLLNSETGDVWLIDKAKKELIPIKRHWFPLESAAAAVNLGYAKQFVLAEKEATLGKLHHSIRGEFSKRIDTFVGALDKEITEHTKAVAR
jgi:hypothetical protein